MKKHLILIAVALLITILNGCSENNAIRKAIETITVEDLSRLVKEVSDDSFMGRQPFTEGERITINWLASEIERTGFEPAFNGSWFQEVPMTEIQSAVNGPVTIVQGNEVIRLNSPDDIAVTSPREEVAVEVRASEMVFAGFGIVAPEYDWNDYRNLDVRNKTVVVLINDPGLYTGNRELFKGREMTYYGRWTYKFEEAARQGATGVLIIHETEGAGYEYTIPRKSSLGPGLFIDNKNGFASGCAFTGWFSAETADKIFGALGMSVTDLRNEACISGYSGFSMGSTIDISISNSIRKSSSSNVGGILRGSLRPDEVIVYSAHWDHFGIGESEMGDSIYNGAVDNGTSIAWALEIGEAFSSFARRPERSIMLFFPTAEEDGLVGSKYYAANPVFDPELTVACFNNDLLLPIGRMKDVMITGFGQSDLDSIVGLVAAKQDRYLMPDPNPHTGMYFRSDHFSFAAVGIPAMFARGNCDSRELGKEWAAEQERDYINNRYHRPADNYDPSVWDLTGIVEDAALMFEAGYMLANSTWFPRWKEGSEFGRIRSRDK
ncbi:MAG: M28 family peptidase [Bacteroidales bacterium]|jgi:Zn-dependent M28 family amino/carboxypeptidase|nr:M28 family peptidase [Bacteroidales bacterium]